MYKIAVNHGVSLQQLLRANSHINNPNIIYTGQTINIPVSNYIPTQPGSSPVNNNFGTELKQLEIEVASLVNKERAKHGLEPLTLSTTLSDIARLKAKDMNDRGYFSHQSPTYGSPFDMLRDHGISYRSAGENIAKGYPDAESLMQGWMSSPGHRQNILNPNYDKIGVGLYNKHWGQLFIGY